MLNNKQREFINSMNTIEEWVETLVELQDFINDDDEVTVFVHNDTISISNEFVRLNGLEIELSEFTFTDFEKIYEEISSYILINS